MFALTYLCGTKRLSDNCREADLRVRRAVLLSEENELESGHCSCKGSH